jgi:hypothetical protein
MSNNLVYLGNIYTKKANCHYCNKELRGTYPCFKNISPGGDSVFMACNTCAPRDNPRRNPMQCSYCNDIIPTSVKPSKCPSCGKPWVGKDIPARDIEIKSKPGEFWCHICLMDKPIKERSEDTRYCKGCLAILKSSPEYDYLLDKARVPKHESKKIREEKKEARELAKREKAIQKLDKKNERLDKKSGKIVIHREKGKGKEEYKNIKVKEDYTCPKCTRIIKAGSQAIVHLYTGGRTRYHVECDPRKK